MCADGCRVECFGLFGMIRLIVSFYVYGSLVKGNMGFFYKTIDLISGLYMR